MGIADWDDPKNEPSKYSERTDFIIVIAIFVCLLVGVLFFGWYFGNGRKQAACVSYAQKIRTSETNTYLVQHPYEFAQSVASCHTRYPTN